MTKQMAQLRIDTGAMKIGVNDEGDFIILQLGDQSFLKRVYDLMKEFEAKSEETSVKLAQINEDETEEKEYKQIDAIVDAHIYFKEQIDRVFGADTCKKVFGDIVPSMLAIARFLEAIEPYFAEFTKKENEKAMKYSANRV